MRAALAALKYLRTGYAPTPTQGKRALLEDWPTRRITEEDIPKHWSSGANVGLVLSMSHLADVDLDSDVAAKLAARFLPQTGMIGGHDARPMSHWFFRCSAQYEKFTPLGDGSPIVELRAGSHQTLVAPSRHPEGHVYRWYNLDGRAIEWPSVPAEVSPDELRRAVARLAAASLLASVWPQGQRHTAALAVAGCLKRAGWPESKAIEFLDAVSHAAGDSEREDRARAVRDTFAKDAGEPVTGLNRLTELLGSSVVDRLASWLDLRPEPPTVKFEAPEEAWPTPLAPEAFHGPTGELVRALEPATEADSAALLIQFLVGFGNLIGRSAYTHVEGDRHGTNLFATLVGPSSKGRKGTSLGRIRRILGAVEEPWENDHIVTGLSSGEGLIWMVRDRIERMERVNGGRGEHHRYEKLVVDDGVLDKRLLVVEPEFASVLQVCQRQSNTLSAVLRQAWDSGTFRQIVKNAPATATDAHISIIAHITQTELLRLLTTTAIANGFGNRFLWVCSRRSKLLPDGGKADNETLARVTERVREAAEAARQLEYPIRRDERASGLWREVYPMLSADRPGLWGSITARAEAQVLRLSLIYAALDGAREVRLEHLAAALAVWQYGEDSARSIWGSSTGDDLADEMLRLLRACHEGVTRHDLHNLTGRNHSANRRDRALAVLLRFGLIERREVKDTGGRPAERWFACKGRGVK